MKNLPRIVAIIIIAIAYSFAKQSSLSTEEREKFSEAFKFKKTVLFSPDLPVKKTRNVHPQYKEIIVWMSSVGAACGFLDYDNDGLYNDVVHIDPRFNTVYVFPAPDSKVNGKERFAPIELTPKNVSFDAKTIAASGALVNDFNYDGTEDVLVFYFGRSPIIFYNIDGEFKDVDVVDPEIWNSSTGTLADFNGDGHTDIYIANYFPETSKLFYENLTDSDQTMQHSMSRAHNGGHNQILLWSGIKDGKAIFKRDTNWDKNLDYNTNWTLAVAAADINNDHMPDLYVANDFGPDKMLLNQSKGSSEGLVFKELKGKRGFTTLRSNVIGQDSFKGMGAEFSDLDNDGDLDLFVSNIAADYALHESHFMFVNSGDVAAMAKGVAPFTNKSEPLGLSRSSWGWDARIIDFNNDGIKEIVQATGFVKGKIDRWPQLQELATVNDELLAKIDSWPHLVEGDDVCGDAHVPLFVKSKSGKFYDVSPYIGLDENQITRGIAIADVNHDGKLDFMTANQWEDSKLYYNDSETNGADFIGLQLTFPVEESISELKIDNYNLKTRPAIGAIAKAEIQGHKLIGYIDGGNGHSGTNSKEIHFSLPKHLTKGKDELTVNLEWINAKGALQKETVQLSKGWHKIVLPFQFHKNL